MWCVDIFWKCSIELLMVQRADSEKDIGDPVQYYYAGRQAGRQDGWQAGRLAGWRLAVFLSSYRNTRESLGELEKAVETLACSWCSHSISRSPKLPLVFL